VRREGEAAGVGCVHMAVRLRGDRRGPRAFAMVCRGNTYTYTHTLRTCMYYEYEYESCRVTRTRGGVVYGREKRLRESSDPCCRIRKLTRGGSCTSRGRAPRHRNY
jgi:hypothetical protein